jgi:hypothetical protein
VAPPEFELPLLMAATGELVGAAESTELGMRGILSSPSTKPEETIDRFADPNAGPAVALFGSADIALEAA